MPESAVIRPTRFRTGGLSQRKPTRFSWTPDAPARVALAVELDLLALHRLTFEGQIDPVGRDEFRLQGQLVAVVDQACIVTLAPVQTEVRDPVLRRYLAGLVAPETDEAEIPADDSLDPLPEVLDIPEIAVEALMLALPLYPRAIGAEFDAQSHGSAGLSIEQDQPKKPFAGLSALAEQLKSRQTPDKSGKP